MITLRINVIFLSWIASEDFFSSCVYRVDKYGSKYVHKSWKIHVLAEICTVLIRKKKIRVLSNKTIENDIQSSEQCLSYNYQQQIELCNSFFFSFSLTVSGKYRWTCFDNLLSYVGNSMSITRQISGRLYIKCYFHFQPLCWKPLIKQTHIYRVLRKRIFSLPCTGIWKWRSNKSSTCCL